MNYVYDILLNFQKDFYDFFDWNADDEIIHIRKIPLFRVCNKDYSKIKYGIVRFDSDFMNQVYNKAERFKKMSVSVLNYVFLISNGKEVMGLKLNKNGTVCFKSSLLLDEGDEVSDMANELEIYNVNYDVLSDAEIYFKTRAEREQGVRIVHKLESLYECNDYEKLRFLYLECFDENEDDVNKIICVLKNEINCCSNKLIKIFDFFKLIEQK